MRTGSWDIKCFCFVLFCFVLVLFLFLFVVFSQIGLTAWLHYIQHILIPIYSRTKFRLCSEWCTPICEWVSAFTFSFIILIKSQQIFCTEALYNHLQSFPESHAKPWSHLIALCYIFPVEVPKETIKILRFKILYQWKKNIIIRENITLRTVHNIPTELSPPDFCTYCFIETQKY